MPRIISVALAYPNDRRCIFQVCAEFLRFIGIYVSEYCKTSQEEGDCNIGDEGEAYVDLTNFPGIDVNSVGGQQRILDLLYGELQEYDFLGDFSGTFCLLKEIFVNNKLLQSAITLQCFRMDDNLTLDAGVCFKNAVEILEKKIGDCLTRADLCHLYYAKIYSCQKVNLSKYLNHESVEFSIDVLSEECSRLLSMVPAFSNVKVLRGMIFENVSNKIAETLDAYEDALQDIGDKYYTSSIHYWIGHRCEKAKTYKDRCAKAYKKAYSIVPKYRNAFKMSIMSKWEEDGEKELQYLLECIKCVEKKGDYLDPLEQEYYFKTNILIGNIYIYTDNDNIKNIAKGISHIQNALKLREGIQNEVGGIRIQTKYYQDIYGEDASKYMMLALKRMKPEKAYKCLVDAFCKVGMNDIAKEYLKLLEK